MAHETITRLVKASSSTLNLGAQPSLKTVAELGRPEHGPGLRGIVGAHRDMGGTAPNLLEQRGVVIAVDEQLLHCDCILQSQIT